MSEDLKTKLEALLFASARAMSADELARLLREKDVEAIKRALTEIGDALGQKESSLMLIEEGGAYRFAVREKYLSFVRKVVTKTEVPKSILETLAVIAYKAPLMQSKLIKIRTNKAYDHLRHLEKTGYITREKSGRTKLIKLTQKFFTYFDVPPDKLKQRFGNVEDLEKAIESKEKEIAASHPELAKEDPAEEGDGVQVVDEPVVFDVPKVEPPLEEVKEKLGGLDVYPTASRVNSDAIETSGSMGDLEVYETDPSNPHEHRRQKQAKKESPAQEAPGRAAAEEPEEFRPQQPEPKVELTKVGQGSGVFSGGISPEIQKKVDERVEAMLNPQTQEEEETQE